MSDSEVSTSEEEFSSEHSSSSDDSIDEQSLQPEGAESTSSASNASDNDDSEYPDPEDESPISPPSFEDELRQAQKVSEEKKGTRKRAASATNFENSKTLKVPRLHNQIQTNALDTIRDLLNEEIEDISKGRRYPESQLPTSQIGLTIWTSEEKEIFFNALAIHGKDNAPMIAQKVGKSVPQVQEYLLLLATATEEFKASYGPPLTMDQVPAAVEVPQSVVSILDITSEVMEEYIQRSEEKLAAKKFGKFWLLNRKIAEIVQNQYDIDKGHELSYPQISDESNDDEVEEKANILKSISSANLLHLPNMLHISRRFFMTKKLYRTLSIVKDKAKNYRHVSNALDDHDPSIRRVAFDDLHDLVISLTRRLVSTTLFQARDRARTMYGQKGVTVMEKDAMNAIDLLGMPRTSFEYWVKMPRRLGLSMKRSDWTFEKHLEKGPITTEQAEEALKSGYGIKQRKYRKYLSMRNEEIGETHVDDTKNLDDVNMESESDDSGSSETDSAERIPSSDGGSVSSASADSSDEYDSSITDVGAQEFEMENVSIPDDQDQDELEAIELEKLDQNTSREQFLKLCECIGLAPDESSAPPAQEVNKNMLNRTLDTAGSWREEILFRSAWEDEYMRKIAEEEEE